MQNKLIIFYVFSLAYLGTGSYCGYQIISSSHNYVIHKQNAVQNLNFEDVVLNIKQFYKVKSKWLDKVSEASLSLEEAKFYTKSTNIKSLYFVMITLLYFGLTIIIIRKNCHKIRLIIVSLTIISLLCLYVGILAPMIEIQAYQENLRIKLPIVKDIVFSGKMYFYYQCKSISDIIVILIKEGNLIVGISILLFSLIFPISKTALIMIVTFKMDTYKNKLVKFIIDHLGKWSMADVFIVACYLSYLSFQSLNTGIETDSSILTGLYFFLTYCLMSILLSALLKRTVENKVSSISRFNFQNP